MRAFTFANGQLTAGISVTQDQKLGTVIFLGESGRGRTYQKLKLDGREPAQVENGKINNLTVKKFKAGEREFFSLCKETRKEARILVRINCDGPYTRGTCGNWKAIEGQPVEVIAGMGAFGDAGRIGTWADALVIMSPGDVVRAKPAGSSKTRPYALFFDGDTLQCLPFEEWEALTATQGEGEEI